MRFPSRTTLIVCLAAICILGVGVFVQACADKSWAYGTSDNLPNEHRHVDGSVTVP